MTEEGLYLFSQRLLPWWKRDCTGCNGQGHKGSVRTIHPDGTVSEYTHPCLCGGSGRAGDNQSEITRRFLVRQQFEAVEFKKWKDSF